MRNSLILWCLVVFFAVACGSRHSALVNDSPWNQKAAAGDFDSAWADADALWAQRDSLEKTLAAIEAYKKAVAMQPKNADAYLTIAKAYYFLGDGHFRFADAGDQDEEKMKMAYDKGTYYAEASMAAINPEFPKAVKEGKEFLEAIKILGKEGVPALYWYSTCLGKWALLDGFTTILALKDKIKGVMDHVAASDEGYYHGAPHRYFGVFFTKIPFPSGDLEKSKKHFDRSVELGPDYLATRVLIAAFWAKKSQNRKVYQTNLEFVMNAPENIIPGLEPEARIEKRKAKQLLADIDDYFDEEESK